MIAIDTSVLVRYLAQDDPGQSAAANRLFEEKLTVAAAGLIPVVTLCETVWVLQKLYGQSAKAIRQIVAGLIAAPNLVVEHADAVEAALSAGAGFADALLHHVGKSLGASRTVTFDRKFARMDGVELLGS